MSYRLLGALLIISGCGGFGISLVLEEKRQDSLLHDFLSALQFMQWDLQYRLTPLPDLLQKAAEQSGGQVREVLKSVSGELQQQVLPDVSSCMQKVLRDRGEIPRSVLRIFRKLGLSLGSFDLPGQLEGLKEVEKLCRMEIDRLAAGKAQRFRSYETLGFCAGLALAILFI